jgi:methionyl-tRNA formyltransferase
MSNKKLRIIFMGTPEFAVSSLQALVENGENVVAVVTMPDKPAGRGLQLTSSPVKNYAVSQQIPVLQPEKLKDEAFVEELRSFNADLQVVVAFRMLPEIVWNMPPLGTFNLHASLLPQYRGAAPINWAIINGEKETGCTTFFLQHEIDTGDIIDNFTEAILPEDNLGSLYEKLMLRGAKLVVDTVGKITNNQVVTRPQEMNQTLKSAPKIFKEHCKIDWTNTAESIHNLVRGLSPFPVAFTTLQDKNCKIYATKLIDKKSDATKIGSFETDGKTYLRFHASDFQLEITELQLEGKKRMDTVSFLRGAKLS